MHTPRTRPVAVLAGLVAAASAMLGCPSNLCLLTVNGRCEWSTCPEGAAFDDVHKVCACRSDRISLNGACLTIASASAYCGKGFHWENGGCAANRCGPGYVLDEDSGYCVTPQQVGVAQGQTLACPPGQKLVLEGSQASCVPVQQTCARDEVWDGQTCRKLAQCPAGSSFDPQTGTCVRFATAGNDSKQYTVDLATWMRASYGADGGEGTSSFCSGFSKHPLAFGVIAGTSIRARIGVEVHVPSGDVANAQVATMGIVEASGQPIQPRGAAEVQQAAQSILASLVAAGGKANAEAARTTVRCLIVNAAQPTVVPATGGG